MKILKFAGAFLYGALMAYLMWLLFYWITPIAMLMGWGWFIVYLFVAGGFISNCGVSMDDVAMCLNHKSGYNTTDQYVKKDWSIIDNANRKVIDYLNDCKIAGTV